MRLLQYFTRTKSSQVLLQELLSSHYDIQLAIVTSEAQTALEDSLIKSLSPTQYEKMQQAVIEGHFFELENIKTWIDWLEASNNPIPLSVLIEFSGDGPTMQILRANLLYRRLEAAYFCIEASLRRQDRVPSLSFSSFSSIGAGMLALAIGSQPASNCMLYLGPVFVTDVLNHEIANRQREIYAGFGLVMEQFMGESERIRSSRYSQLRSVVSKADVQSRFAKLTEALRLFSCIEIEDLDYQISALRKVGSVVLANLSTPHDLEVKGVPEHRIPFNTAKHFSVAAKLKGHLVLRLEDPIGTLKLSVTEEIGQQDERSNSSMLTPEISKISDQVHTNTVDQRLENILVYRGWIFDYMGEASAGEFKKNSIFAAEHTTVKGSSTVVEKITCAWLATLLRADVVTFYRFNHQSHQIVGEVFHATTPSGHSWGRRHIDLVKNQSTQEERKSSYIYETCQSGVPLSSNSGDEVSSRNADRPTIPYFLNNGLECPGSIIVLPIMHGKRVFGAIDCVALAPFSFDDTSSLLLEEFSDLLGKYFVAQANARLMDSVRSSTGPQKWHKSPERRFDDLAIAIADYFLVHSATIWLLDTYNDRRLVLEGAVNRDFLRIPSSSKIHLNLEDESSVTAKAIRSGTTIFGEIGEGVFGDTWLKSEHRSLLIERNFRYIAIVPIIDGNGKCIGALTLLSRNAPFTHVWNPQFHFCARTVATVLADFRLIQRVIDDGLSETTHEILQIAIRIKNSASKLTKSFNQMGTAAKNTNLLLQLDDITEFSRSLQIVATIMSPSRFVQEYSRAEFAGSPMVRHYAKEVSPQPLRIKAIFNQEWENARKDMNLARLLPTVTWDLPEPEEITIDRRCTEIALRNVLSNAIKYSPFNSELEVNCEREVGKRKITLRISSFGPRIGDEEISRLFERRFRGRAAIDANKSGRGEGLYQADSLMKAQGCRMSHTQDKSRYSGDNVWQIFRLVFPY